MMGGLLGGDRWCVLDGGSCNRHRGIMGGRLGGDRWCGVDGCR